MSRSKRTDPREIRAARRVRDPFAPRGKGNIRLERAEARALKSHGVIMDPLSLPPDTKPKRMPRIIVSRPRKGCVHPASKNEIVSLLKSLGDECIYGVRSIELVQGTTSPSATRIMLATLQVPGRVLVYDHHPSPWRFLGRLEDDEALRFRGCGAWVDFSPDGIETTISWPGQTLRDLVLFEGLMHEIGHHLIQHHKGKRTKRVARTRDHEAFAESFARRCRAAHLKLTRVVR